MLMLPMNALTRWLATDGNAFAVVVTAALAVLLACCLACTNCSCRDKDDIFRHHTV